MHRLTIADKVISFNKQLQFSGKLPKGFHALNPYIDNPETMVVMEKFYRKYYSDFKKRILIIGINPSRHGAGVTGVPFTDTKRLESECGIAMHSAHTHEVSSVFMYDMITAFGGAEKFYGRYYINSPFPLAIVKQTAPHTWLNANYYDDKALFESVKSFMMASLLVHIGIAAETSVAFILGKKNADYIKRLTKATPLFDKTVVLEHPRYIQQYKLKEKDSYIHKYLEALQ